MKRQKNLWEDTTADAIVEATILFPIIIMIFMGLFLLSNYLPVRATLQEATQYAANAVAIDRSDTWLYYNEASGGYALYTAKSDLPNVYVAVFQSLVGGREKETARQIVEERMEQSIMKPKGELDVDCKLMNYVLYKEIEVTATYRIPVPVNLSFVRFPTEIPLTVTSVSVVQNGDEYVRNLDLAGDFLDYLDNKYHFSDVFGKINEVGAKIKGFLGI